MTEDTNRNIDVQTNESKQYQENIAQAEEFLSLREIIIMILRHRWKITAFVALVTIIAAVFFLLSPRVYKAEGYLQVVPPVDTEGRVDKNLFETTIISHLQRVKASFVAKRVANILKGQEIDINVIVLQQKVNIMRPAKTDLIRIVAGSSSPDTAVSIVNNWLRQYLDSVSDNYVIIALSQVRALLKKSQRDIAEKQGAVAQLKKNASEVEPLITLSKAVDNSQLWKELADNVKRDSLKSLSDIHIKGQEESTEYVDLKSVLLIADKNLASALANRAFYQEVEHILEARANGVSLQEKDKSAIDSEHLSDAQGYVNILLKSHEIIQFGEPALMSSARGALKKTSLVFVVSLFLACFCAFTVEWLKGVV